ncbi:MAG: FtsW/RodA/SpoVE family cell cycle protein [Lachnospiraceae bacterium]|nr:FtsW/RodA/SpoVE family cell cycle protein [Lachnospiraceae bacterium]MDD3615859.1 FtsW/RodA/SpoVE family cell cycle protein [Lachnospiraceae bacterium]
MIKQYRLKDYNFRLVLYLILISIIGVLLVNSAMDSQTSRQIMGICLGVSAMVIVSLFDFSWVLNFYWLIYAFNIVMLLGVRLFGESAGGATRWVDLGFVRFQPTELSKILLILFFARYLMDHEDDINRFRTIVQIFVLALIPLILIYVQPDMKNTITVLAILCIMIFITGLSYKIIGTVIVIMVPLIAVFLLIVVQPNQGLIKDYQRNRIMSFLYPDDEEYKDENTQQNNAVTAIGSGQLTGKGLNNDSVSSANKGNFISEIHTDFIFVVAGEELGFVGCFVIILLLFLIAFECVLAGRRAKDTSGKLICCGVASVIGLQSFINIGVATGLLPNTGTPLPFVSYGLTSMVSLYIGMGFVLNVGLQRSLSSRGDLNLNEKTGKY